MSSAPRLMTREAGMKPLAFFLSAALSLILSSVPAGAQDQNPQAKNGFRVRVQALGSLTLWDDWRSELVISTYQLRQGDQTPLVNIYNVMSGEKRTIDVLKGYPNARVTGLASGPKGAVLVVCEMNLDDDGFTFKGDHLLVYDNHSTLTMNLTTADYVVGAVAMDKQGNVYLVGTHDSERSSDESYPLLVKYDSRGKIRLKTLSRSLFANIDDPIGDGIGHPRSGGTRVAVSEKAMHVYLAPAGEMVVLNQSGEIQKRVNVASKLSEFAKTKGYRAFYVDGDEFRQPGICGLWVIWKSLQTVLRVCCLFVILSSD
jgi:hypothetical protein